MHLLKEYIRLLVESALKPKVIFMAGAPGSGKSTIRSRLGITGFEIVDPDEAYEAALKAEEVPLNLGKFELEFFDINNQMKDALEAGDTAKVEELKPEYERMRAMAQRKGKAFTMAQKASKDRQKALAAEGKNFIVDGTAADYNAIRSLKRTFEAAGYDTAMLFVHVDIETAIERNRARGEAGGRSLRDRTIEKNWQGVHENEQPYRELFGDNFFYVDATNMDRSIPEVKRQMKRFIGNIISESIADRRLSSADIDYLEKIADTWAIAKEKKSKDPSGLQTVIYDFYTKSHDDYKKTMSLYDPKNKSLKNEYDIYWENIKKAIETSGQRRGWETVDGGAWTQFTKPFTGAAEHGTGNYKFYLTFTRGDNLKDFFENVAKLPTLLANINDAKTTGKVSFKIASQFGPGLHHKDNVVIHYKMATDAAALKDAVKQTGFNLMDRASVGRLDTGVDIETSDSNLVAKVAAEQLLTPKFINILDMYLSKPKGSYEYKQGLSLLNKYLSDQMEKSSHRAKRNA